MGCKTKGKPEQTRQYHLCKDIHSQEMQAELLWRILRHAELYPDAWTTFR